MESARWFGRLLMVAILGVPAASLAEPLMVDGKLVHPGCIYELTTRANGDNVVSAVHLSRTRLRGCLDSNRYHQDVEDQDTEPLFRDKELFGEGWFYYSVVGRLGEQTFVVRTADVSERTYVGREDLVVRVGTVLLKYVSGTTVEIKKTTILSLLGEIDDYDPERLAAYKKVYLAHDP